MKEREIRQAGLKVTLPRVKIIEILENSSTRHMSAEDIYKALLDGGEDIGLATVYRVLTQFEAAGLARRQNFDGGHAVYELEDGEHHDHMVCIRCGRVVEFVDPIIEERQKEIAREQGWKMTDHSLIIYGIHAECQKEGD